jgi:hypothetical protein
VQRGGRVYVPPLDTDLTPPEERQNASDAPEISGSRTGGSTGKLGQNLATSHFSAGPRFLDRAQKLEHLPPVFGCPNDFRVQ